MRYLRNILRLFLVTAVVFMSATKAEAQANDGGFVAVMRMNMMILPGTLEYLKRTINQASSDGAKIVVVELDTPGGILTTSQEMIQEIFKSPVPVVIYVSPSGATATSAGVFITLAGHVAAMAPGTSIGAAHPVAGDGKDIEGDMRTKAENMTIAMVKTIAEQRGRNVAWAEKSVKESNSITEKDALKEKVIDVIAPDIKSVLSQVAGKEVKIENETVKLADYSNLPIRNYEISFQHKTINILANPNVVALLWLAATTGLSIELYSPGAILPGVVGLICLIAALAVSQIIPITQGGIILIVLGALMIASEFFFTSGILGVGGVVAMVLGSIYLIDVVEAPGMGVSLSFIIPVACMFGLLMLAVVYSVFKTARKKPSTGNDGMVGLEGRAMENFGTNGRVFVNGEVWKAKLDAGFVEKDQRVKVVAVRDGLILEITKI